MENRAKKLLFDVLVSGRSIRDWCDSRTFTDYERDRQLRRAVEREFEIIGEALNRLAQADPTTTDRIQDLARIVGFRNRIVHGYDRTGGILVAGSRRERMKRVTAKREKQIADSGELDAAIAANLKELGYGT